MIALNKDEIRSKSIRFWALFSILLFSTLIIVYFFIWSSQKEGEDFVSKLQQYRAAQNKQIVLQPKIDSLYKLMTDLEKDDQYNVIFLKAYIQGQRKDIKQLIGADSISRFGGYSRIVSHLDEQIVLQDTIVRLKNHIEDLRRDIENCKTRSKSINRSLIRTSRQ